MSLTRKEWLEMYQSTQKILKLSDGIISDMRKEKIRREVEKIQQLIESVVGQLR